ncbi:hypothetical protein AZH53_01165 [Methanomicrobiaceae archaeon CYW5]|uniref:GIY-YIG nuclease family protein n=1 Tax=Methanovulcanius yangii TaxID=1789227 RepID=UPI0038738854|nr:hypothetical protein [Methanovulcanius yangii]
MRGAGDYLSQKRDTVNYTLRDRNKIVYMGITNDLDRRIAEHERDGKRFTNYSSSTKRTQDSALKHETEDLARYKRNQGRFPKYNDKL